MCIVCLERVSPVFCSGVFALLGCDTHTAVLVIRVRISCLFNRVLKTKVINKVKYKKSLKVSNQKYHKIVPFRILQSVFIKLSEFKVS